MGSETMELPVIDFSNLKHQTEAWESSKALVRQALEDFGCFEATFDGITLDLRRNVIDETKQVFGLPLQVKLRNRSNKPYHGYVGQYPMVPLYESLGIEDALSPEKLDSFTNKMWSQGKPSFSKSVGCYAEQLSELDKMVRRMMVESLGLHNHMDDHMGSTNYLIRLMKYDSPRTTHEAQLGLTSHTDKNIVTILYQNQVNGLQVLTKHGHWIDVQPSPNSFIVMIGDAFHAWTNGRLHSPFHKVMMRGDEARYSIGLFSVPKAGYIIQAPAEMVDDDHPLLFKPFDHHQFLDFYYTPAGQTSPAALKEYCGL